MDDDAVILPSNPLYQHTINSDLGHLLEDNLQEKDVDDLVKSDQLTLDPLKDPIKKIYLLRLLDSVMSLNYILEEDEFLLKFERETLFKSCTNKKGLIFLAIFPLMAMRNIRYFPLFITPIISYYYFSNYAFFKFSTSSNAIFKMILQIKERLQSCIYFLNKIAIFNKRKIFLSKKEIQIGFAQEIFDDLASLICTHMKDLLVKVKYMRNFVIKCKLLRTKCGKTLTDIDPSELLPQSDNIKDLKEILSLLDYVYSEYVRYTMLIVLNFEYFKISNSYSSLNISKDLNYFLGIRGNSDNIIFKIESLKNASKYNNESKVDQIDKNTERCTEEKLLSETLNNLVIANDLTFREFNSVKEKGLPINRDTLLHIKTFIQSSEQLINSLLDENQNSILEKDASLDPMKGFIDFQLSNPDEKETSKRVHRLDEPEKVEDDLLIALPNEINDEKQEIDMFNELDENRQFQHGQRYMMAELKSSIAGRKVLSQQREDKVIEKKSKIDPKFAEDIVKFKCENKEFNKTEGNKNLSDFFKISENENGSKLDLRAFNRNTIRNNIKNIMERKVSQITHKDNKSKGEESITSPPTIHLNLGDQNKEFRNELFNSLMLRKQHLTEETFE